MTPVKEDKLLMVLRRYRIISMLLTIFTIWWGYDAYLFVNSHLDSIKDFALAFYISVVGLAGWVIKHWMGTTASEDK